MVADRRDELLVLWGNSPWDGHRLGAQFLAEQLAQSHHVLYVDPPVSAARAVAGGGAAGPGRRLGAVDEVGDGLRRCRTVGLPGLRRPGVRQANGRLVRAVVGREVRKLGLPVRAVISGYLDVAPFGFCGERLTVCRISDDFSAGRELRIPVERMARAQHAMADAADAVVVVSPVLADRWSAYAPVVIPNGADVDRLHDVTAAATGLPEPVVGYSGQLSARIDLALLEEVARRGHSLLLVGGRRPDLDPSALDALLGLPNVAWTGEVPYTEVPSYLGAMTVGLLPYTSSDFNRASFPLKLLEYLAAGLAPVSTDLPAVRWLGSDLIRVADDPAAFADAVEAALEAAPEERDRGRHLAEEHSWAARAADYESLLDRLDQSSES